MSKINLLSSKIYNRIAAGEVVERPCSVVKELVENSIDANATVIKIEIVSGGIVSIKITDNGTGIEKSELKKALLPHATSKISNLKDLDNIVSLGFRGEALASIASVSKITISSKPSGQEIGATIYAEGGNIGLVSDCGMSNGTEIVVNNLFFNTPARAKFLKSERSEESDISTMVSRFILGNPNISFKYIVDGNIIYQSFGEGFEEAMVCVYGANVLNDCFFIDTEKNGIKIFGYVGKHYFTKGNKSYQTVFLNGRYVTNQTIVSAISNAYSAYVMKRQYPFYSLSIFVPPEIVDVNVHPNKLDVRFANNQIIYGSIYSVVSKVLDGTSEAIEIVTSKSQDDINIKDKQVQNNDYVAHDVKYKNIKPTSLVFDSIVFNDKILDIDNQTTVDVFAENKAFLEKLEKEKNTIKLEDEKIQVAVKIDRELKYIGQVLNTFLIFEDGVDVYLVDQHAAHERILFDKLMLAYNNNNVVTQPLLVPYVLNVNTLEYGFLIEKIPVLSSLGIDIFEFGHNAFKISAIPAFLTEINLQNFFNDILSEIDGLKTITINDLLLEKLMQKACKAAIKAGDKLSELEIKTLKDALQDNLGLKCPHGRPIAIKITRTEIDKWFKRIV